MTASSILVIAAHPDDEVLGCGGSIAKYAKAGSDVSVAFLADGVSSRDSEDASALKLRRSGAEKALGILGVRNFFFGTFPDNSMDTVPMLDVVKAIEAQIQAYQPKVVLTHHSGDVNIDHRRVHEATIAACRPQSGHPVRTLLFFEVASSTEWQAPGSAPAFVPNWFEDISDSLRQKQDALEAYAMEMRAWPHPRSLQGITSLARWRGATIGVEAAEAFVLGRNIA